MESHRDAPVQAPLSVLDSIKLTVSAQASVEMLALRAHFVRRMGWRSELHEDDTDRYDGIEETLHLARYCDAGNILVGMRLTKLDSIHQALSLEMVQDSPLYKKVLPRIATVTAAADGGLWDLTRLVHSESHSTHPVEMLAATLQIFGAGFGITTSRDRDPRWVYLTTREMKYLLDGCGIVSEVLAAGRVSSDDESESYFCVVSPVSVVQYLEANAGKHGFALRHITIGKAKQRNPSRGDVANGQTSHP